MQDRTPQAIKDARTVLTHPGSFTGRASLIRLASIVSDSAAGRTPRQIKPKGTSNA